MGMEDKKDMDTAANGCVGSNKTKYEKKKKKRRRSGVRQMQPKTGRLKVKKGIKSPQLWSDIPTHSSWK